MMWMRKVTKYVPNIPRILHLHLRAPWNGLIPLLEASREYAATDPRDKEFSLHGMLRPEIQSALALDYRETVQETYAKTAVTLAKTHGIDLTFLL